MEKNPKMAISSGEINYKFNLLDVQNEIDKLGVTIKVEDHALLIGFDNYRDYHNEPYILRIESSNNVPIVYAWSDNMYEDYSDRIDFSDAKICVKQMVDDIVTTLENAFENIPEITVEDTISRIDIKGGVLVTKRRELGDDLKLSIRLVDSNYIYLYHFLEDPDEVPQIYHYSHLEHAIDYIVGLFSA